MAKVLRGGKWGPAPSRSTSHSQARANQINASETAHGSHPHSLPGKNESILSFVEQKNQLAVAVYESSSNSMSISKVPCFEDYSDASRIVALYEQCFIVLPNSYQANDKLLVALGSNAVPQTPSNPQDGSGVNPRPPTAASAPSTEFRPETSISFLPNGDFSLKKSRELCPLLSILDMPKNLSSQARMQYLSHIVEGDNLIIRAIGGLLAFILQQGVLGILQQNSDDICINAISRKNLCNLLRISPATQRSLNIFSYEAHPLGRGGLTAKEGLSLFGILKSHVKTAGARNLLRSWLLHPLTDVSKIRERQLLVRTLKDNGKRTFLITIRDALRGVKNVSGLLARLRRCSTDINDWNALHSSAVAFIVIIEALRAAVRQNSNLQESSLVSSVLGVTESHIRDVARWIESVVDFEESREGGRLIVSAGFSSHIDDLKRTYSGLDELLRRIGIEELSKTAAGDTIIRFKSCDFKYIPHIGFLIAIPPLECEQIGMVKLEEHGFQFIFSSDDTSYHFKNKRCLELDEEIGDIYGNIIELESQAFSYLGGKILEYSSTLLQMDMIVKELDCLQAFAVAANEYSWNIPDVLEDGLGIEIEDGRHPLMELNVSTFVPNSTRMRFGDVHVLSGPNYSGKSVYLTQAALIVVLTQIGSCVPAKKARMAVFDSINGCLSSIESVTEGQSHFFADASQVAAMLTKSTGRALNILDEFGKGTADLDGMALLTSVIRHLAQEQGQMCMTICVTHCFEILKEPFLPLSNARIGLFSMQVEISRLPPPPQVEPELARRRVLAKPNTSLQSKGSTLATPKVSKGAEGDSGVRDGSNIVRTYRVVAGSICDESRALQCALEAGVPTFLLKRAAQVREAISKAETIPNQVGSQEASVRTRRLAERVRSFVLSELDGAP